MRVTPHPACPGTVDSVNAGPDGLRPQVRVEVEAAHFPPDARRLHAAERRRRVGKPPGVHVHRAHPQPAGELVGTGDPERPGTGGAPAPGAGGAPNELGEILVPLADTHRSEALLRRGSGAVRAVA